MKLGRILIFLLLPVLMTACGGGGGSSSSSGGGSSAATAPAPPPAPAVVRNVLPITVNGPGCNSYLNEACISVTICTPGTSNCQTINGILLDTGSYGLRVFKQVITVPLTQVTLGPNSLAECVQFMDGSSEWGPVQLASVILGNEAAVQVPIHVIDSTFVSSAAAASSCPATLPGTMDQSPAQAGFNGILGIGPFVQDCGSACVSSVVTPLSVPQYDVCNGSSCIGTAVPLADQVQNPTALLTADNNGVIVELPGVPAGGATSVNGSLVLGIGTQSNNSVSGGVSAYSTDSNGDITTVFNGIFLTGSFIDSGSNGLFFPSSDAPTPRLLPNCADFSDWFCPASTVVLTANNVALSGAQVPVSFSIGNFDNLLSASSNVFPNIGGNVTGAFEWGLPFFFGRNIYVGIEGTSSSLARGPYFAY